MRKANSTFNHALKKRRCYKTFAIHFCNRILSCIWSMRLCWMRRRLDVPTLPHNFKKKWTNLALTFLETKTPDKKNMTLTKKFEQKYPRLLTITKSKNKITKTKWKCLILKFKNFKIMTRWNKWRRRRLRLRGHKIMFKN